MSEQTVIDVERRLAKVEWTVESHADELAEMLELTHPLAS